MASLTKNQLINELINHGVKPPASGAKKEKLVEMYEEHVSHFQEAAGEFSSDDEAEKRVNGEEGSVSSFSTDVADLSNDELLTQLRAHGAKIGPIVGSTRRLYERKLAQLMEAAGVEQRTSTTVNTSSVTVTNGRGDQHDQFSDSEGEDDLLPPPPPVTARARLPAAAPAPAEDTLRYRRVVNDAGYGYRYRSTRAPLEPASVELRSAAVQPVYLRDWDDQPSPRRGVHEVRGSYNPDDYVTKKTAQTSYASLDHADARSFWADLDPKSAPVVPERRWLRPLVKLCVLLLLIAAGVYCYQNYGDSSSVSALQEAARAAVQNAADRLQRLRAAPAPAPAPAADQA